MDPNQNTQPTQPETVVEDTKPAKKLPFDFSALISKLKTLVKKPAKINEEAVATENITTQTLPETEVSKPKVRIPKKVIIGAVIAFVAVLILIIIISMVMRNNGGGILPSQSPSPSPTETPVVDIPSQYADDEDVNQIKEQIQQLNDDLNNSSFRDETLRVPNLDWDVNFK